MIGFLLFVDRLTAALGWQAPAVLRPEIVRKVLGGSDQPGNLSYLYTLDAFDWLIICSYFGILFLLSIYGFYRLRLIYIFLRYRHFKPTPEGRFDEHELPRVTVQLPIFNEVYVVERLLKAVTQLDYPGHLLEIQVLDDSIDETAELAEQAVERYRAEGHNITYIHRDNRAGFKAGALANGLNYATGDFIAIFDADFIPRPDTLRKMIDYFTDPLVGVVQMRWSYINADYNTLTRIQQIMLDAHFVIEQTSRSRAGGLFNFNGTAGMWRRTAIEWSGGWQTDTLAEDTDLSYRAQLFGWKFIYLLDEDVPSELPVDINSFKVQQRRWAKGVLQVGQKLIGHILRSDLPLRVKLELFFRFTNNANAPLIIILSLLHWPVLIVRFSQGWFHLLLLDTPVLIFATTSVIAYYGVAIWHLYPDWKKQVRYLPLVMAMGIGLAINNARAALEVFLGVKSSFARTPKFRIESRKDDWRGKRYHWGSDLIPMAELALAIYFMGMVHYAVVMEIWGTIPFLLLFLIGYGFTGTASLIQSKKVARSVRS
ncbi:MAG: glycosyltransferase [Acidobacteria bacterium]|nr:glycosyltransferase [Acidobacteriota bacterium]